MAELFSRLATQIFWPSKPRALSLDPIENTSEIVPLFG